MSATHHYLNLAFAHLQIVLVVDIHPFQGTAHPLICSHEEHDCKATCRVEKDTKLNRQTSTRRQTCHQKKKLTVKNLDAHNRFNYNQFKMSKTWVKLKHHNILTRFLRAS